MKQLARVTASVLLMIGLLLLLWQFSSAVLLFLLSLFIAATARPLANRLIARGLPRAAAHSVVYVFGVALFAALVPWLMLNHHGLSILVHPNTRSPRRDHVVDSLWIGAALPINEAVLPIEQDEPGGVSCTMRIPLPGSTSWSRWKPIVSA